MSAAFSPEPDSIERIAARLEELCLFDIAEAAARVEAEEWDEEAGLNLFLEDTIALLRRELELMPRMCFKRTQQRARVFAVVGNLSEAVREAKHYQELTRYAEVYLLGVPDAVMPQTQGLFVVPLVPGSALSQERTVLVESSAFGAVMFAHEAGQLDQNIESSRYFEGFLTAREDVVHQAAKRMAEALELAPLEISGPHDANLVSAWQSRLNTRFLEQLEGQKLALRARNVELNHLSNERSRLEKLARSYMGGKTWEELLAAVEDDRSEVFDYREDLTICFCDLVGFTSLSERLHPEEIAGILNEHFARLHSIVSGHGGWIDKFIGDAMLAIFKDPVEAMIASQKMVHETRAAVAGTAMEQTMRVRVGLNTGTVAVASLGVMDHRERTVLGDAVNLAQRLQTLAMPRSVVLSSETFGRLPLPLTRHLEPFETMVKGKREPILAYRWSVHSDRLAPNERVTLRESLLNAGRRAPLSERLQKGGSRLPPSE